MMAVYALIGVGIVAATVAVVIDSDRIKHDRAWAIASFVLYAVAVSAFVAAIMIAQVE